MEQHGDMLDNVNQTQVTCMKLRHDMQPFRDAAYAALDETVMTAGFCGATYFVRADAHAAMQQSHHHTGHKCGCYICLP